MTKIVCLGCGRVMDYDLALEPDIPSIVARIEQANCSYCWEGELEVEAWFDVNGNEVPAT